MLKTAVTTVVYQDVFCRVSATHLAAFAGTKPPGETRRRPRAGRAGCWAGTPGQPHQDHADRGSRSARKFTGTGFGIAEQEGRVRQ